MLIPNFNLVNQLILLVNVPLWKTLSLRLHSGQLRGKLGTVPTDSGTVFFVKMFMAKQDRLRCRMGIPDDSGPYTFFAESGGCQSERGRDP